MKHHALPTFWECYRSLPDNIRKLAEKNITLRHQASAARERVSPANQREYAPIVCIINSRRLALIGGQALRLNYHLFAGVLIRWAV